MLCCGRVVTRLAAKPVPGRTGEFGALVLVGPEGTDLLVGVLVSVLVGVLVRVPVGVVVGVLVVVAVALLVAVAVFVGEGVNVAVGGALTVSASVLQSLVELLLKVSPL